MKAQWHMNVHGKKHTCEGRDHQSQVEQLEDKPG
jgi:hypothetical protein